MRILIVGGGMAGWTLAGHLRRRGHTPTLIEKAPEYGRVGFSIALYPFSAGTLRETGVHDRFLSASRPLADYVMRDARGDEIQRMSMPEVMERIGATFNGLHRADLLDVLVAGGAGTDVRMGTTLRALGQVGEVVEVELSDGTRMEADLVVGADGIHSQTRTLLLGDLPLDDTGITAFTWWMPDDAEVGDDVVEHWGAGGFFGLYPLPGTINAIGALPTPPDALTMDQAAVRTYVRRGFSDYPPLVQRALEHLDDGDVHLWPMADVRSPEWIVGRVALVGDSAVGFLPTAGVGASNAIKSAAVLADELGRADARSIPLALSLWEQRMRHRVEAAQETSRRLAKFMWLRHRTAAHARDILLRHYPVDKLAETVLRDNTTAY